MSLKNAVQGPSLADLAASARSGGSRLGRVRRVLGEGSASDRLRELGFTAGTEVAFLRSAPLGDPLCFRLRGTELCLRRTEAALIEIEPAT